VAVRLVVLGGLPVLFACADPIPTAPRFRVARIEPDPAAGPLRLNRELEIQFSGAVDPGSVTPDSIQVLDAHGRRAEGTFELSDFVVKFWPRPPVTPALDDGTWQPGARYTLRILGFPSPNAVRQQRTHAFLPDSLLVPLAVVDLRSGEVPFLPEDRTPFVLREPFPVRVADDGRRLIVRMSKPPDPRTITNRSFSVHDPDNRALAIDQWQIDPGKYLDDTTRGCRLDLVLRDPVGFTGRRHWLVLGEPPDLPRDYGGEPLGMFPQRKGIVEFVPLRALRGAVLHEEFDDPAGALEELLDLDQEDGILAWSGGRLRPFVLAASGAGTLGAFTPVRDTVLAAGVPFDPGDGQPVVVPDGDFQFASVRVPPGVRVVVRGPGPVAIRSQRGVRIDGVLEVECPRGPASGAAETLDAWLQDARQRGAGGPCLVVTSGGVHLGGSCALGPGAGVALRIAAVGPIGGAGLWPVGVERARVRPAGAALALPPGQLCLTAEPDPQPNLRERYRAAATSTWRRLDRIGAAQIRLVYGPAMDDARVRVTCRLVGPDPNQPEQPHVSVAGRFDPGPLLPVPGGARFAQIRVVIDLPAGPCPQLPQVEWVTLEP
jgi:hypothetical protein